MPCSPRSVCIATSGHRWSYHRQLGTSSNRLHSMNTAGNKRAQHRRSVWWQKIYRWFTVTQMKTAGVTKEGVNGRTWVTLWQGRNSTLLLYSEYLIWMYHHILYALQPRTTVAPCWCWCTCQHVCIRASAIKSSNPQPLIGINSILTLCCWFKWSCCCWCNRFRG